MRDFKQILVKVWVVITAVSVWVIAGGAVCAGPIEPDVLWEKTYGGVGDDVGNSIQVTADGGYIVVGSTDSFGAGGRDVWLIKTDGDGEIVWEKTFGGADDDSGHWVQVTAEGGYIIVGGTRSFGAGSRDVWLIKTDGNGEKEWDQTFGRGSKDTGNSVQVTADGGYIVVGETSSFGADKSDIWLFKTDGDGNKEWGKIFGGDLKDFGYSVQVTAEGGYIVVGRHSWQKITSSSSGGTGVYFSAPSLEFKNKRRIWLIKRDGDGKKEWAKHLGRVGDIEYVYSVQVTADGGYVVAGSTRSMGSGKSDVVLIKTDGKGKIEWKKALGGALPDFGAAVQVTADGGYVVVGGTRSIGARGWDVYLIKTGSPDANTVIVKALSVKAGKNRTLPSDSFAASLQLPGLTEAEIANKQMQIDIISDFDDQLIYSFNPLIGDIRRGRYKKNYGAYKLNLDLNKKLLQLSFMKADLTGLRSPVRIEIITDNIYGVGMAYDGEVLALGGQRDVINGKKPMPMQLLLGYANALRVDKCNLRLNPKKPAADSLIIQGAIAVEDMNVILAEEDVLVQFGDYELSLPAANTIRGGTRRVFKYKYPKGTAGPAAFGYFDLDKSQFRLIVKNDDLDPPDGPVDLRITFAGFDQTATLFLKRKNDRLYVYP